MGNRVTLTDKESVLGRMYDRATRFFVGKIDPQIHVNAYIGEHEPLFAESEFAGKYLDTAVRIARLTGDPTALKNAEAVVRSIVSNQRADGYIGGLKAGGEFEYFSVWNQSFTMLGLLSYYDFTRDSAALSCAERIARWVSAHFTEEHDILSGWNDGSQHLSFLLPLVRLCRVSGDPAFPAFAHHIVSRIKGSDNDFFRFDSIFDLRSKKGIENFVIHVGILEYGQYFGDPEALAGCERYWDELNRTQIRENGNGTMHEKWTPDGNRPRLLGLSDSPDENCVAVGWIELGLSLYFATGKAFYLDAVEKTYYNHLAGALERDGSDFAYYQPNYGRRVSRTAERMYKCCRYRGYSAVSILPEILFRADSEAITLLLYANAEYSDENLSIREETDYPYGENVRLTLEAKKETDRALYLRVPAHVSGYELWVDGVLTDAPLSQGWLRVDGALTAGKHEVKLVFEQSLRVRKAQIDGVFRASYSYGTVLLAAETENDASDGAWEKLSVDSAQPLVRESRPDAYLAYRSPNGTLFVDFASSGRNGREFSVWVKDLKTPGTPEFRFRRADKNDAEKVLALYESVKGQEFCVWNEYYPSSDDVANDLANDDLFVLESRGSIVGAVSIVPENELDAFDCWESCENAAEFARVAIAPAYQGKGLARVLVRNVLDVMKERGVENVHISVARKNLPAKKTYACLGFKTVGSAEMWGNSYDLCEYNLKTV